LSQKEEKKEENQKKPDAYKVSPNVLEATVNYLLERPYRDVANLINALQQSQPVFKEENANK